MLQLAVQKERGQVFILGKVRELGVNHTKFTLNNVHILSDEGLHAMIYERHLYIY